MRKVLTRLEAEGLIGSVHGVGTIVTDVDIEELAQVYRLRMELAPLLGKLDPIPRTAADLDRIRAMIDRMRHASTTDGDARAFLRLNMAFVQEVNAMTANRPLREISERLYIQVARVVMTMMPELGLAAEFRAFRREMDGGARGRRDRRLGRDRPHPPRPYLDELYPHAAARPRKSEALRKAVPNPEPRFTAAEYADRLAQHPRARWRRGASSF